MRSLVIAAVAIVSVAGSTYAALSPQYVEFGQGPAQWWMTNADKREWSKITTDEQAQKFIDLFWARRDPTPGTPRNEFREEFEARVKVADTNYAYKHDNRFKRGSMTDMGRVFILLGPATVGDTTARGQAAAGMVHDDSAGGSTRQMGEKTQWLYTGKDAQKFGMPKIEVLFIQDVGSREYRRDPQRMEGGMAMSAAVDRALVSPKLTEVPEWTKPPVAVSVAMVPAPPSAVAPTETVGAPASAPTPAVAQAPTLPKKPAPLQLPKGDAGAHHLTLTKDANAIAPQSGRDPFANVSNVGRFVKADDLNYAFEYCVAGEAPSDPPTLRMTTTITGTTAGPHPEDIRMKGEEEDVQAEAIKAMPGCYVVRAAIPLADMDAGTYTVSLQLTDPLSKQTYNLTREFRIE